MSARSYTVALVLGLGLVLAVRALELRLPGLARDFWEDELHHNEPILSSPTSAALDTNPMYVSMMQPKLDFWMRKVVWLPLLGVNERALRLPALFWDLVSVLATYAILVVAFARRTGPRVAALLAFIGALWIVDNPTCIQYAAEARHYSLVTLASVLWCAALLVFEGRSRLFLGLAALLFVNVHFFALPLVAAGYALTALREVRARRWDFLAFHLLVCVAIFVCVTRINAAPFDHLLHRPPGDRGTRVFAPLATLRGGLTMWLAYGRALALWPAAWLWWGVVLGATVFRRRWRWVPLLVAVLVLLPAIFTYMHFRSGYEVYERYYTPFFGFGLVTIVAAVDVVLEQQRWQGIALGLYALVLGVPALSYGLPRMHLVAPNFSSFFKADLELVRERLPTLVVHAHCFTDDTQRAYFDHIVPRSGEPHGRIEWLDARRCDGGARESRAHMQRFLDTTPADRLVVLDRKDEGCSAPALPALPAPVVIERMRTVDVCMWKLRGVTTRAQIVDAALEVGMTHAEEMR